MTSSVNPDADSCLTPAQGRRPKRIIIFNLTTDADDPVLGFTSLWIRKFAEIVPVVSVLTMKMGRLDLPPNVTVRSAGLEKGWSRPRRLLTFYRHLIDILKTGDYDGCFSHMMPLFSALGGPLLRIKGIPLVTWYAHPNLTRTLRIAHYFSNRMVTSLPKAYPYRADKLSVIGQGIDTNLFKPSLRVAVDPTMLLCVGRLSPVKDHPTLIKAFSLLANKWPELKLNILGLAIGQLGQSYLADLRGLVNQLNLGDRVVFLPPVPISELPDWYSKCKLHINLTPAGFGDKVAWESMACGRPCLVSNTDFKETLGNVTPDLMFDQGNPADLAEKISRLLQRPESDLVAIGLYLRAQVDRLHSIDGLTGRVLSNFKRL